MSTLCINKDVSYDDYNFLMYGRTDATRIFFTKMPTKTNCQSIKNFVTFRMAESSEYEKQRTLEMTSHTQNGVLAKNIEMFGRFKHCREYQFRVVSRRWTPSAVFQFVSYDIRQVYRLRCQLSCSSSCKRLGKWDRIRSLLETKDLGYTSIAKNPTAQIIICRVFEMNWRQSRHQPKRAVRKCDVAICGALTYFVNQHRKHFLAISTGIVEL